MKTKTIPFDIKIANEVINGNIKGRIKCGNMVLNGKMSPSFSWNKCFDGTFKNNKGEEVFIVFNEFGKIQQPLMENGEDVVIELPVEDEKTNDLLSKYLLSNDTITAISNDLIISLIQLNQLKECMKQMMEINQNLINNLNSISESIKKIL